MKKISVFLTTILVGSISYAQINCEEEIKKIYSEHNELKRKAYIDNPEIAEAVIANDYANVQARVNSIRAKCAQIKLNDDRLRELNQEKQNLIREKNKFDQVNKSKSVYYWQEQQRVNSAANLYDRRIDNMTNSLNNLTSSLLQHSAQIMHMEMIKEANRKVRIMNTYGQLQNDKIDRIQSIHNRIPNSEFKKKVNGIYSAHLIGKKKFALAAEQKLLFEEPILINVLNNEIKDIYLYGKEKMKIDLEKIGVDKLLLKNGFTVFYDSNLQEDITIILLDPYIGNGDNIQTTKSDEVGYITVWSPKEKLKDKKIYIQELDSEDNLVRQIETKIYYAKSEKDIPSEFLIPINTGNKTHFLGRLVSHPILGNVNLYPKISSWRKNSNTPIKNGDIRYVEIKKYYE